MQEQNSVSPLPPAKAGGLQATSIMQVGNPRAFEIYLIEEKGFTKAEARGARKRVEQINIPPLKGRALLQDTASTERTGINKGINLMTKGIYILPE